MTYPGKPDLELFHPRTKERIDFDSLTLLDIINLEGVTQEVRALAKLKIEKAEEAGDLPPRPIRDLYRYCGLILTKCQWLRSVRKQELEDTRFEDLYQALEVLRPDQRAQVQFQYQAMRDRRAKDQLK